MISILNTANNKTYKIEYHLYWPVDYLKEEGLPLKLEWINSKNNKKMFKSKYNKIDIFYFMLYIHHSLFSYSLLAVFVNVVWRDFLAAYWNLLC